MTLLRESVLYPLLLLLRAAWEDSGLRLLAVRAGNWWSRQAAGSALLRFLLREGAAARSWPGSAACRLLSRAVNLPGRLLREGCRLVEGAWEDSFFARLAFRLGEEAAAEGWLLLALWVIPAERWRNTYALMAFLALLLLLCVRAMGRDGQCLDVERAGFYPVLFFGAVFLSAAFSPSRAVSARALAHHVTAALCAAATAGVLRSEEELKRLAAAASGCVAVSSLCGVLQRLRGVAADPASVDMSLALNAGMPGRVCSFFGNANTFAQVLLLLLPLTLALALSSRRMVSRLFAAGAFCLGVTALGMTYSRAGWIGFACAMAVMVFLWNPRRLAVLAALCVLAAPFLPGSIWNRILTIGMLSDSSTASRFPLYRTALRIIRERPLSGAGLGVGAVQEYVKLRGFDQVPAYFVHSHNLWLQVWAETGLLGIVSFTGAVLWGVKRAARAVRHSPDSAARTITCAACASLCGAMVCGLADYLWSYPRVMCMFWFVFALALCGADLCGEGG